MARSYTRTTPVHPSELPRCEAWMVRSTSGEIRQCPHSGSFVRDGHRVCLTHQKSAAIAFSEEEARQVRKRVAWRK